MPKIFNDLFIVGLALFIGLLAGRIFDRVGIPEIIGMVITGLILGPNFLSILNSQHDALYKHVINLVLSFFGFFIGAELRLNELRRLGRHILSILIFEVGTVFTLVFASIYVLTNDWVLSIFLATLSVSTAPAATADVIWEYRAQGPLSTTILALIGFDDIVAVLVYTLVTTYTFQTIGVTESKIHPINYFINHVGISIIIGVALGISVIFIGKTLKKRKDIILLAIGIVVFSSGLVEVLDGSEIISSLIIGFMYENYFKESPLSIDLLRDLTSPIFTLFFVVIGSQLSPFSVFEIGTIGLTYIGSSIIGKTVGSKLGAKISNASPSISKYIGFTLYSQAGVALGLAHKLYLDITISGGSRFLELGNSIVNIATSSALVLLIIGPFSLRYALTKSGEAYKITREELILED